MKTNILPIRLCDEIEQDVNKLISYFKNKIKKIELTDRTKKELYYGINPKLLLINVEKILEKVENEGLNIVKAENAVKLKTEAFETKCKRKNIAKNNEEFISKVLEASKNSNSEKAQTFSRQAELDECKKIMLGIIDEVKLALDMYIIWPLFNKNVKEELAQGKLQYKNNSNKTNKR